MNDLELCIRPGAEPLSWNDFRRTHPAGSIALDGYVCGSSQFDPRGPWLNFDHHADVDRLSSRATCSQVLLAIRQGLLDRRSLLGRWKLQVFVNDCDEDICLSWYLLTHPHISRQREGALDQLVQAVDLLDTTAGACLHPPDENLLRQIAWVFEPYRFARLRGSLDTASADGHRSIINAVGQRIAAHLDGSGGITLLDLRYERIFAGNGWEMVAECGAQARLGMVRNGIRAYVSVRERPDGRWSYSLGRTSPFVPFDIPRIVAALNEVEYPGQGTWGGGNLIAGSPRQKGSRLSPSQVADIVADGLSQNRSSISAIQEVLHPVEFAPT
jgi:hypothetical protein